MTLLASYVGILLPGYLSSFPLPYPISLKPSFHQVLFYVTCYVRKLIIMAFHIFKFSVAHSNFLSFFIYPKFCSAIQVHKLVRSVMHCFSLTHLLTSYNNGKVYHSTQRFFIEILKTIFFFLLLLYYCYSFIRYSRIIKHLHVI